jgi:hypothetical protein
MTISSSNVADALTVLFRQQQRSELNSPLTRSLFGEKQVVKSLVRSLDAAVESSALYDGSSGTKPLPSTLRLPYIRLHLLQAPTEIQTQTFVYTVSGGTVRYNYLL